MSMQEITSLRDILNGIELTAQYNENYANTLRGPRTQGSFTRKGIDDPNINASMVPVFRKVDQSLAEADTVIYQSLAINHHLEGTLGAKRLLSVYTDGEESLLRWRVGKHLDPELFLDRELADSGIRPSVVTFIVADEYHPLLKPGALITWHPGEPLLPLSREEKSFLTQVCKGTAKFNPDLFRCGVGVKTHRG